MARLRPCTPYPRDWIIRASGRSTRICTIPGRAEYVPITDTEAVDAFEYLSKTEGIIPAIESAHAVAYVRKLAPEMRKDQIIVVNISGRGDKDVAAIARYKGVNIHE